MSTLNPSVASPQELWDNQVASIAESAADWLLPGFVARGNLTLLTSMWKAGKTTLLTHLLERRASGRPLFGLTVSPGKTVVISEEPRGLWADRCRQTSFGGKLCLFPQPFPRLPTAEEWRALIERIGDLHAAHGVDLLVIDSLTHFLRAENVGSGVLDLILPVRELTARGMAALLMHHPRRQGAGDGIAGRGHGAIHSEVDISIEMRHAGNNLDSRARSFFCLSRHAATPRRFSFELNADGADYTVLPTTDDDGLFEHWEVLRAVLEDAPQKLTRLDILDEWPDDFPRPHPVTLWEWLQSAARAGLVEVEGSGRRNDPFRYWLPSAEARWRENPLYEHEERQARELRLPFVSLREDKRRRAGKVSGEAADSPTESSRVWPSGVPVD